METKPDVVEEATRVVKAVVDKPKKATPKKKAQVKRKKATKKKPAARQAAKPVVKETPLTTAEIRETITDARTQLVEIGLEPVTTALASWSSTIRGAVGGFMDGLLNARGKK
jgi:outer membrane biosynthesis protein TonB